MKNDIAEKAYKLNRTEILELFSGSSVFLPNDLNFQSGEVPGRKDAFDSSGKDKKKLLILVQNPDFEFYSEEGENTLIKMLKALGHKLSESIVLNIENATISKFAALQHVFGFERMLAFGVAPKDIDLNVAFRKNEIGKVDGTAMLFTHSLEELIADAKLKRPLWSVLQKMFGLTKPAG